MDKIKTVLGFAWDCLLDGIDIVTGWIERHPRITLALIVLYLMVRR